MGRTRPEHWSVYNEPSGWYSLAHPSGWRRSEVNGVLQLITPDGASLALRPLWQEAAGDDPAELLELNGLFPRRRRVRPADPLDIDVRHLSYQGEARPPAERWWQRLFGAPWRPWQVWVCRAGRIGLIAVGERAARGDPETAGLFRMVMNTLEISEDPADPPDHFSRRVLDLARRKFPLLQCETTPDFQLKVGDSSVNLLNFYRSYINSPEQFEQIVLPALTTLVQVQEWGPEQLEPDFADVRERIMPMLYPEAAWQERFPHFAGQPWVAGVAVLYVVDEAQAYWYVRDELLQRWGMDCEELHEVALANLDRYFSDAPMELAVLGEETGPRLLLPAKPDAYNTSRLLSATFQHQLRDVLGSPFAAGIPSRDFFIALTTDVPAVIAQVRDKVAEDFRRMDHPLSTRLLLVSPDGVSELDASAE